MRGLRAKPITQNGFVLRCYGPFPLPRGRPRGAKNLATLVGQALDQKVSVSEQGRHRKVTKREAIIKQLVNQSATADWRAVKILLDMLRDIESRTESAAPEASSFSVADEKVIEQLKARFSKAGS